MTVFLGLDFYVMIGVRHVHQFGPRDVADNLALAVVQLHRRDQMEAAFHGVDTSAATGDVCDQNESPRVLEPVGRSNSPRFFILERHGHDIARVVARRGGQIGFVEGDEGVFSNRDVYDADRCGFQSFQNK